MQIGPSASILQALGSSPSPPGPVRTSSEAMAVSVAGSDGASVRTETLGGGPEAKARLAGAGEGLREERNAASGATSTMRVDTLF
jgi:hypothetical protein